MRITSWTKLAPSLSSASGRGAAVTAMAAASTGTASIPTWQALLQKGIARHKNDPTAKYCQLATAAIGGGASCRTWVFRGFYEDKGALTFVTDRRSQKVPEIAADPVGSRLARPPITIFRHRPYALTKQIYVLEAGEVCFYLKKTREQFRVKGRLQVVDAGESDEALAKARRHQWTQISPASQTSFESSLIPGLGVPPEPHTDHSDDGGATGTMQEGSQTHRRGGEGEASVSEGDVSKSSVSDEFCLVLLWPSFVDHLRLADGQSRSIYKIRGDRDGAGVILAGVSAAAAREDASGGTDGVPQSPVTWVTMAVNP
ncbi:unnamed protein product [Ectocarpus sp. CCAP 1310/34]|nr:unnamed protein product [Ectocarpus sp. CCAP 1310/34]